MITYPSNTDTTGTKVIITNGYNVGGCSTSNDIVGIVTSVSTSSNDTTSVYFYSSNTYNISNSLSFIHFSGAASNSNIDVNC